MRPAADTPVASATNKPTPPSANWVQWNMCQSLALPSTELYSHIGATTIRFGSVRPRSRIGSNNLLLMAGIFLGRWNGTDGLAVSDITCRDRAEIQEADHRQGRPRLGRDEGGKRADHQERHRHPVAPD